MLNWFWGALGALALLLLKIWIEQEIKAHGWPGLTRKLGNIGYMLSIAYAGLLLVLVVISITYHLVYGLPRSFFWPLPRAAIWLEGIVFPGPFAYVLFRYRKNVMLLLTGIIEWLWGLFLAYGTFSYELPPQVSYSDFLANHAEGFVGYSVPVVTILAAVALAAAGINYLYGLVDAAD